MFLRVVSAAMLLMAGSFSQAEGLESVKMFDGKVARCESIADLGVEGYFFRDIYVSEQEEDSFTLSVKLDDRVCKRVGSAMDWVEQDIPSYGTHRIVGKDGKLYDRTNTSEVLAYTESLQAFATAIGSKRVGDANVAIDVRMMNILTKQEKESLARSGKITVPVYIGKRTYQEHRNMEGRMVSQIYGVGGVFKVMVTVEKRADGSIGYSL